MPRFLNQTKKHLSEEVKTILEMMFSEYQELIVKTEFTEGFSDSHVFLVRPCRFNSSELPAIVKVGPRTSVQQEWEAFQHCIQHRLPTAADIQLPPIFSESMGGLRYQQIGEGTFGVESLGRFCFQASISDIDYVLRQRLFTSLSKIWKDKRLQPDMLIRAAYDSILPVNLIVDASRTETNSVLHELNANAPIAFTGNVGDFVQIIDFQVTEISFTQRKMLLNSTHLPYRLYVTEVPNIEHYEIGKFVSTPLTGQIVQTRKSFLAAEAKKIVSPDVNLQANELLFLDKTPLPNPLKALSKILSLSFDVYTACIHGDLHLNNVLIEPVNRNAYLIDFAKARRDHVLRDLLHLEMSVLTGILPVIMAERNVSLVNIRSFYESLHNATVGAASYSVPPGLEKPFAILTALRSEAREYLYRPNQWQEYYAGLFIYLLSALKFDNLDTHSNFPLPKQLAFWGAAIIQELIEHIPDTKNPIFPYQSAKTPRYKWGMLITFVSAISVVFIFGLYFLMSQSSFAPQRATPTIEATQPIVNTNTNTTITDVSQTATKTPFPTPTPSATSRATNTATAIPTLTLTATFTPTPSIEPQLIITYSSVNLRAGPGNTYEVIDYLIEGTAVTIIESSRGGRWYHVLLADGEKGWLAASVGQIENATQPISTAVFIPPSPTQTPTSPPTSVPTAVSVPPTNPTRENVPATSVPTPKPPPP